MLSLSLSGRFKLNLLNVFFLFTTHPQIDLTDDQKTLITTVMKLHMGDEKVLIAAIELLQNLVVTTEPDDILIKKVGSVTGLLLV